MLINLDIKNVALIESLSIELSPGLVILSGETGAGKSIIIDALGLALGERADRSLIRAGCEKASVQALFDVSGSLAAQKFIEENELECDGGICAASREITVAGRSVCRLCGQIVPLGMLKNFTSLLVDIHGQHEHQSLLREEAHIGCIDEYAHGSISPLLRQTRSAYTEFSAAEKALRDFAGTPSEMAQKIDMLSYQINEIEMARLKPGEEEELLKRKAFFKNALQIAEAVNGAKTAAGGGAASGIMSAAKSLAAAARFDEKYQSAADKLEECYYVLEDLGYEIAAFAEELDYDEREVDAVEERLEAINGLKRKYGNSIAAILEYQEKALEELDRLAKGEETIRKLRAEAGVKKKALEEACETLTAEREKAAKTFCGEVIGHLADLNMAKTRFAAEFERKEPSASGQDFVRFMISPNPGEPLKPLSVTASGGELSRVMLALKSITAKRDGIGTMIFDEIDSGISGRVSAAVAGKMRNIASDRQVLCVTHLATIAAAGTEHFLIEKKTGGERTVTVLTRLEGESRAAEIARLTGGGASEAALIHAREMLRDAASGTSFISAAGPTRPPEGLPGK